MRASYYQGDESVRLLEQSLQTVSQTETTADITINSLQHQREQLESSVEVAQDIRGYTDATRKILTELRYRQQRTRIILWGVIVMLMSLIILVSFRMATNHGKIMRA